MAAVTASLEETPRPELAARALWDAWDSGRLLEQLPQELRPADTAAAHAVQAELGRFAGGRYGWKIAATSQAGQEHIAVDGPIAGRLFERFRFEDGAVLAGISHMAVVEAEIAFRMGADLDGEGPLGVEEVLAAVEVLQLAVEIPDSRFDRFETVGGAQLIADDSCAGRVVLGPEIAAWRGLDLRAQRTAISVDGERVAEGIGANVLEGPAEALTWLANDLRSRGDRLGAGDFVLTGTTTVPAAIGPGSRVVAEYEGLGQVRLGFES